MSTIAGDLAVMLDALEEPSDHHACEHSVQFYEDDGFLLDGLSRYIGSALGAGDSAIIIATNEHRDGLAQRLRARGLDLVVAAAQGRYVALDAAATLAQFMVDGSPDARRFNDVIGHVIARATAASSEEHPRVAAFGEMVALLWEDGNPDAAIRLEQHWNDLADDYQFDLHCAYPMRFFSQYSDGPQFGQVCAEHNHVVPSEGYMSLLHEDARLRNVALLQQKAQALETEIQVKNRLLIAERDARAEVQEALAKREEFLSVAAHELKTPITSLRTAAQVLLRQLARDETIEPARLVRMLSILDMQSDRLAQLANRLLDISRLDAGQLTLDRRETDLVDVIRSVVEWMRVQTPEHTLTLNGPDTVCLPIDALRIEQVIVNLVDNAIKYGAGGREVEIDILRPDAETISFAVRDHGVGLTPEQQERVFDRFYRATGSEHASGLGLGLYISREIVERHGGRLWVESPPDGGARFVVSLPLTVG